VYRRSQIRKGGKPTKLDVIDHHQSAHLEVIGGVVPIKDGPRMGVIGVDKDDVQIGDVTAGEVAFRGLGDERDLREIDAGGAGVLSYRFGFAGVRRDGDGPRAAKRKNERR
jgi:hypothetical protein